MRKQSGPLWRRAAADVASAWLLKGPRGVGGPRSPSLAQTRAVPLRKRLALAAAPLTWGLTLPQKRRENANKLPTDSWFLFTSYQFPIRHTRAKPPARRVHTPQPLAGCSKNSSDAAADCEDVTAEECGPRASCDLLHQT